MKRLFEQKGTYKPRFRGYYLSVALIDILSGILTLFALPFGYVCVLHYNYAEYNLRKDYERRKINRKVREDCMKIWEYKEDVSNS